MRVLDARAALPLGVLLLVAWGCSSKLEIQTIRRPGEPGRASKIAGCPLPIEPQEHRFGPECREIGDVFVGDTGWSHPCGWERMLGEVRKEGCRLGADAAQIVAHHEPSFWGSTCHQVRARFVVCGGEPGQDEKARP